MRVQTVFIHLDDVGAVVSRQVILNNLAIHIFAIYTKFLINKLGE